jgi:hypothetical protein
MKVSGAKLKGLRQMLCQPVIEGRGIKKVNEVKVLKLHCCGSPTESWKVNDIENKECYTLIRCRKCKVMIEIKKKHPQEHPHFTHKFM